MYGDVRLPLRLKVAGSPGEKEEEATALFGAPRDFSDH